MADWNLPTLTDLYVNILSFLKNRDVDLAKGLDPAKTTVTNPQEGFIRWNSANKRWEIMSSGSWVELSNFFNINVDKVDGSDAGIGANNVLRLDSNARIPVGNLPPFLASAENLTTGGFVVRTNSGTAITRGIGVSGQGLSIVNSNGAGGTPTLSLNNDVAALEQLSGTGFAVRTGADTWTQRLIAAGAGIAVTHGDGVGGDPSISISSPPLLAIAGLTSSADTVPLFTGADTAALMTVTPAARALLDDTSTAAMLATLGALIGGVISTSGTTTLGAADRGRLVVCSGTSTVTVPSVAVAGPGYAVAIKAVAGATVTVSAADNAPIDNATSVTLQQGESAIVVCDGASYRVICRGGGRGGSGRLLRVTRYTTPGSGTWTKPSDTRHVIIRAVGGGGAGMGGGGGGGGAGGCCVSDYMPAAASYSFTVGAGGAGGNGNGGSTTIAGMTAGGGQRGQAGPGGAGGTASGGALNIPGGAGHIAVGYDRTTYGGQGGSSAIAPGGGTSQAGVCGSGGGGGSISYDIEGRPVGSTPGGAGGAGIIEIFEYS